MGNILNSFAIKVLATLAIVGGGGGILIYSSMSEAEYYKHVDEVTVAPEKLADKTLRIHGFVEAGSIHETIEGQKTKRTFVLKYNDQRILVRSEGPKPDTFKELAEVVAKGTLVSEGGEYVLHATELTAKCPSKYEGHDRTTDFATSKN